MDIKDNVYVALHNCQNSIDDLTQQESAAIHLYLLLNQSLCDVDRDQLKPWFLFLKLFLTALHKLSSQNKTVWCGVKNVDLSGQCGTLV
jgi:hypothetical protein